MVVASLDLLNCAQLLIVQALQSFYKLENLINFLCFFFYPFFILSINGTERQIFSGPWLNIPKWKVPREILSNAMTQR